MKAMNSPIIEAEMRDWTALGGQNWGILGAYDGSHPTGFHRAGFEVPPTDYSRRHDPGTPYNMAWASAGDFAHVGKANLRAIHAGLLARLMAGDPALSMIVEFIGQPWPDKPVMYWARWDGIKTLKRYTGKGHDQWSHISWQRSRGNERAYLWAPASSAQSPGGTDDMAGFARGNDGQLYYTDMAISRRIVADDMPAIVQTAAQGFGPPIARRPPNFSPAEWEQVTVRTQVFDVRLGWGPNWAGPILDAPAPVSMTDAQVENLAEKLAARPDNPLTDADVPTLVRAFKQAAREGTGS